MAQMAALAYTPFVPFGAALICCSLSARLSSREERVSRGKSHPGITFGRANATRQMEKPRSAGAKRGFSLQRGGGSFPQIKVIARNGGAGAPAPQGLALLQLI